MRDYTDLLVALHRAMGQWILDKYVPGLFVGTVKRAIQEVETDIRNDEALQNKLLEVIQAHEPEEEEAGT